MYRQPRLQLSGLSRSPFGFGSNVSLSTLHLSCCDRQRCKTRYVVVLVHLLPQGFHLQDGCSFNPGAPGILGLTKNTVDTYRRHLIEKMEVSNITQAVYL